MYGLLRDLSIRVTAWLLPVAASLITPSVGAGEEMLPSFPAVHEIVNDHFSTQKDFHHQDLISKRDVLPIFASLANQGWKVADQKEILALLLDDGSALVQTMRSRNGRKFMRKVSGYRLIYDRLDRIARESGGRRLLTDLAKLPDAQRYAKMNTRRGLPSMVDFLPKTGSGRRRQIKDYDKPTGRIYTVEAFVKRLQESHSQAHRELRAKSS